MLLLMNGTRWGKEDSVPRPCAAFAPARDRYGCAVCMALIAVLALRARGWRQLSFPVQLCSA